MSSTKISPSRLELEIWHPDCWTLEVTQEADAGLIAHGVYTIGDLVNARITAFGGSMSQINSLVNEIKRSQHTQSVQKITSKFHARATQPIPGNVSQDLLVSYHEKQSIHNPFILRGFIPDEPIQIEDGFEVWTVVTNISRSNVQDQLEEIRVEMNAEIEIKSITSQHAVESITKPEGELSARQQEVFTLAQDQGYYEWPRAVSADDLAAKVGISKTTLLEHLRKAEAKLLDPD
ncbi:helix-turn-helix domain-containing protein [Halococcus sediminicola]|uniref:helix-turn-helix domain-containing protein n=1 Tax=Halococcus sediminicola TaxID=1264579 RepID=UPI0009ADBB84|nr:helix-turn-helix domain-containing protein [Halococcus sediminicola]